MIGADLIKDRNRLISAYDDSLGVTAEFNKNLLVRINRELFANFDIEHGFQHRAVFNDELSRIEMHLVSLCDQRVYINDQYIDFAEGEFILTENSHKYSLKSFAEITQSAGLKIVQYWTDPQQDFALFLLHPCK